MHPCCSAGTVKLLGKDKFGRDESPPAWKQRTDLVATWKATSATVDWSGSTTDAGPAADALVDAGAAAEPDTDTPSGSSGDEALEAQYKKLKELNTEDWRGSGRNSGIIRP